MDNNSFTLSLAEVEGSIIQSFAEVFGSLDQHRIVQLLLFESANELLPTAPRDYTEAAAFLHAAVDGHGGGHFHFDDTGLPAYENADSEASGDPNNPGGHCWSAFTTMKGAFKHIPAALNLDVSIQLECRKWTSVLSSATLDASASQKMQPSAPESAPAELTPVRRKTKALSYSARYELFNFGNQVLFKLAQSIVDMSPNVALDIYQMCILILGHLRHSQEKGKVEKVAVMLAVKVGRRDAAIWHGESVLKFLQGRDDNISEMLYMTDLLAAQYSENAQYELAAKALFSAISVLNQRSKVGNVNRHSGGHHNGGSARYSGGVSPKDAKDGTALALTAAAAAADATADSTTSTMEFERALDPLLLKLGKLLLQFGVPDRAADTFQVLLSSLCERTDCLANDAKKVTVLSWLAEAYLQLEDFASCKMVIKTIKLVRAVKLHKATATALGGPPASQRPAAALPAGKSSKPSSSSSASSAHRGSPTNSTTLAALQRTYSRLSRTTSRDLRNDLASTIGPSGSASMDGGDSAAHAGASQPRKDRFPAGIATTGSNDSFDQDTAPNKTSGIAAAAAGHSVPPHAPQSRPLPPTPNASSAPGGRKESIFATTTFTSPVESGALRSRPLPPTPRSAQKEQGQGQGQGVLLTPRTAEAQALHSRPLPATPLEKKMSECSMDSSSAQQAADRRSVTLNSVFAARPLSSGAYQPVEGISPRTPDVARKVIAPGSGGGGGEGAGAGSKQVRKSRVLKNLQPLQTSGSVFSFADESNNSPSDHSPNTWIAPELNTTTSAASAGTANSRSQIPPLNTAAVHRNPAAGVAVTTSAFSHTAATTASGAAAAVNSIFLHYLRNPPEANLPQFCATSDDLDLGLLQARLLYKNRKYSSALKSLLPTLIGVELLVIGVDGDGTAGPAGWSRQALMELGELYYLRGKIQLEAASSCADVSFPLHLGTSMLFEKVCALLAVGDFSLSKREAREQRKPAAAAASHSSTGALSTSNGLRRYVRATKRRTGSKVGPRTPRDGLGGPAGAAAGTHSNNINDNNPNNNSRAAGNPTDGLSLTCTEAVKYSCPADLCWDAMAWFRRARDVARLAGDELGGALAANRLAMNHLMPMFVPHALYRIPLERARDLSPQVESSSGGGGHWSLSKKEHNAYPDLPKQRLASLTEVQHVMEGALDVHLHTCLPLPLMDAYLNLAEMCSLLGNKTDAVAFWVETKELFLHLFADGALIPLLRRASMHFIRKIQALLHRIVRFMWTLDQTTANSALVLIDMQVVLSHEAERVVRRNAFKAGGVSHWLPDVLDRTLPQSSGSVPSSPSNVKPSISGLSDSGRRKRNSISRMSRFFSRMFATGSSKNTSSRDSANAATTTAGASVRATDGSGKAIDEFSSSKSTTNKLSIGLQRMKSSTKTSNSFDSFIERSGFDPQLDVRRFYNLMNADLVLEKVHDYGWSACVEHAQLLRPIDTSYLLGPADPELSPGPYHSHRRNDSTASATASGDFGSSSGVHLPTVQLVGTCGVADIDALIVLNERAKTDCELKYRSLASAYFLYDHILLRGQMVTETGEAEAEGDGEGAGGLDHPGAATELSNRSNLSTFSQGSPAEMGALLFKASLSPKGAFVRQSSFLGTPRTPRSNTLLTGASSSATASRASSFFRNASDKPIDPFADFDWMDESFADYSPHSRSLQARTMLERQSGALNKVSRAKSKYKRMILGDAAAQFGTLFMPEFDEAHLFSPEEIKSSSMKHDPPRSHSPQGQNKSTVVDQRHAPPSSRYSSTTVTSFWAADTDLRGPTTSRSRPMPVALNAEYLRDIDRRAETVLIQRTWRCYLLLLNAQWGYRSGRRSMEVLRGDVRSALCSLSLNMVRLRAFSRQYQGTMLEFDRLQQELPMLPSVLDAQGQPRPIEESGKRLERDLQVCRDANINNTAPEHVRASKKTLKDYKIRKPILLQHRLPFFIYAIHVSLHL